MGVYVNSISPYSYMNYNANYGNGFSLSNYTDMSSTSIFEEQYISTNGYSSMSPQLYQTSQQQNSNESFMQQLTLYLLAALIQQKQNSTSNTTTTTTEKTIINDDGTTTATDETETAAERTARKKAENKAKEKAKEKEINKTLDKADLGGHLAKKIGGEKFAKNYDKVTGLGATKKAVNKIFSKGW